MSTGFIAADKDPVSVLKDYAGLVDLVHLKDYRIGQLPAERIRVPTGR